MIGKGQATTTRLVSQLAIGQWFRPPFSSMELWLLIWSDGQCLRFGPSEFEGACRAGNGNNGGRDMPVLVERPWFDVVKRLQPTRLGMLKVGQWFEWAGQPTLVVGGPGGYMTFDPLLWCSLGSEEIAVPLDVQIRTDSKPLTRRLADWWRS